MKPITILLLLCWSAAAGAATPAFQGVQVVRVQGSGGIDLSGLALCRGGLYAIADKVDDRLYRVSIDGGSATLHSEPLPPLPSFSRFYRWAQQWSYWSHWLKAGDALDWEDLACMGDAWYLLSERKNAVAVVRDGAAGWLDIDWYSALRRAGYLNRYNGFVEGLAVIDADHLLVAIEREPRGLLRLTRGIDRRWSLQPLPLGNEQQLVFRADNPDVSALQVRGDALYTLERNASAICRRDLIHLRATSCYSFAAIENAPAYRYTDARYGIAEGMAMDAQWIYVVFDNNGLPLMSDAADRRSLLLKIPMPLEWR